MSKIKKIEVFFLEYPFPKKLNYKYSAGVVENMIIPVVKLTDSNNENNSDVIEENTENSEQKLSKDIDDKSNDKTKIEKNIKSQIEIN